MRGSNIDDGYLKSQGERGAYVLLHMKAILVVAAIALISSCLDISMGNPCELKEALDLISLNYAPFCKYNATIEESGKVLGWGIAAFCGHSILCLVILSACMWPSENKTIGILIIFIVVFVSAVIFTPLIFIQYKNINDVKKKPAHRIDYERLKSEMLQSLEKQFASDDPTNGDTVSSGWNNLFIKYNCCAVKEVQGTTNDFDNTPWCTTSGTCADAASQIPKTCCKDYDCCAVREVQTTTNDFDNTPWCTTSGTCADTASQIPKTCCKNVTVDNYQDAPSTCHAAVNTGTYKPGCFQVVKSMSLANVEAYQVSMLSLSLFMLILLQILDIVVVLVVAPFVIYDYITTRK